MQQKKLILLYKKYLPILLVGIFSFVINYYYGFIGVMPMDNFVLYNGGYRVLNGYIPFNDYWLVTGPLLDYLNALFFFINGTSWNTYIIHSSLINLIISVVSYLLFVELGLQKKFSFMYSIFFSVLFYPIVGAPFVDHHATFFLIIAFYLFIFGIVKKDNLFIFFIPFFFVLSFLSKQTPAAYGLLSFLFILTFYLLNDLKKNIKILKPLIFGSVLSILFLALFFFFSKINFLNFYEQYILYAKTIGDFRFSTFKFDFFGTVAEYKFILILLIILTFLLIELIRKKNFKNIITILTIMVLSGLLIFHQYYSFNQNFIFFLIPLLSGLIHIFSKKDFKSKFILALTILICIYSTTKYHIRFNEHRKFNELEKVDLSKAIDANVLSKDLKGLKWITHRYPNDPQYEINNLKKVMKIISQDKSKRTLITNYQFLAPTLKTYDFSPNQWHHPSVSFPLKNQKYYNNYKTFFIKNLKKNNIDFIYETFEIKNSIVEIVLDNSCFLKEKIDDVLTRFILRKDCKDFR
jgi:hypothetical protein